MLKKVALLGSLFLAFGPGEARAFTLGSSLTKAGWDTKELTFLVNESSCTGLGISTSDLEEAIDAAFSLWNSVPTSNLKLVRGATTTLTGFSNNPPVIWCDNTTITTSTNLGQGGAGVSSSTGRPVQGGLVLNGKVTDSGYFGSSSAIVREITVAHEIGHVLGLGHSDQDFALMYYNVGAKADLRLSQDDIDGITWLNPRNEPSDKVMGCATVQTVGGSGGGGGGSSSLLLEWAMVIGMAWVMTKTRASLFPIRE